MDRLERYIEQYSAAEDPLLAELDRMTNLRVIQPKMVSGRVQGAFLKLITHMFRPELVLEIGTFTGYSALSIAAGMDGNAGLESESKLASQLSPEQEQEQELRSPQSRNFRAETQVAVSANSEPCVSTARTLFSSRSGRMERGVSGSAIPPEVSASDGEDQGNATIAPAAERSKFPELHTVEIDDELEDIARSFFARSPHGHKIRLHIGSALEVVPKLARSLGRPFDMVFIDGDKREYPDYYRMLMGDGENTPQLVCSGGIILVDNVLWYGKVAEPEAIKSADRMSQGILEFNRMVAADPRVENVILPLRDGINLIRVK